MNAIASLRGPPYQFLTGKLHSYVYNLLEIRVILYHVNVCYMWVFIHCETVHQYVYNIAHHTVYCYSLPIICIQSAWDTGYLVSCTSVLEVEFHQPWGKTSICMQCCPPHCVFSLCFTVIPGPPLSSLTVQLLDPFPCRVEFIKELYIMILQNSFGLVLSKHYMHSHSAIL